MTCNSKENINSMNLKRFPILFYLIAFSISTIGACTSAIVSAEMNPYGRPLLWKNRDTSNVDNKIEYVEGKDGEHSYVGLFNASDLYCEEAWMGMNDAGFAIMNTASYNIKDDNVPEKEMDKEGILMAAALKSCVTVEDFEKLLDRYPRPLGVEANFGVIDAYGDGAFFETNNHSYVKYDLKDSPDGVLVRTNYSHSGRPEEGFGFIREANAEYLLEPYISEKNVTPEVFTEVLSRSFRHELFDKDFLKDDEEWMIDQDFIPRYKSTATIVIEGCKPLDIWDMPTKKFIEDEYIMWTGLGYPPCSEIYPVICKPDGVDNALRGILSNGHSEASDIARQRRDEVFPLHKGNGDKYIKKDVLKNSEGTGYLQTLIPQNLETYRVVRERRGRNAE